MEKAKSDKKKEKPKSKVNIITTNEELRTGGTNPKKPISFDPALTAVEVPFVHVVPLSYIIDALKDNDTVTSLTVSPRSKWDKKDLKEFVTCLSSENRGIKKLVLRAMDFELLFMEAICKILKANPRIQTIEITAHSSIKTEKDGVKIFCDNMEHFKFSELMVTSAFLSMETYELLLEGLKSHPALKILKFYGEPHLEHFPSVFDILASNNIIEYWHWGDFTDARRSESYVAFKRALNTSKYLKKLKLEGSKDGLLSVLYTELKTNLVSITDLTLANVKISWKEFGEGLKANKTIKRLELKDIEVNDEEILFLDLGSNETITDLTIGPCSGLDYTILFSDLCRNQTIQKLELESTHYVTADPFKKYLTSNHSLRELKIGLNHGIQDNVYSAIAESLRVNRTLRKLSFKIIYLFILNDNFLNVRTLYEIFSDLIEALKVNTTVTHINFVRRLRDIGFDKSPINGNSMDDFLLDLLKTNKTLRHIEGASEYPHLEERLKENREAQDRVINSTCIVIKMIVAKPFIFPLEIWLQIFEHLNEGYFDFVAFLRKELNSPI